MAVKKGRKRNLTSAAAAAAKKKWGEKKERRRRGERKWVHERETVLGRVGRDGGRDASWLQLANGEKLCVEEEEEEKSIMDLFSLLLPARSSVETEIGKFVGVNKRRLSLDGKTLF